ncbi:hypothetical protein F4604DRAFT_1765809 [Suillus subluteus]|nr:hypothetical protein F4604DRAFT_1765809 [Suillus subluteus]
MASSQPGQSAGSHALHVTPLELTQTQRDELDQTMNNMVHPSILSRIRNSDQNSSLSQDYFRVLLSACLETEMILERDDLFDRNMLSFETIQQYPQLQNIIHTACITGIFSRICDTAVLHRDIPDTSSPTQLELARGQQRLLFGGIHSYLTSVVF